MALRMDYDLLESQGTDLKNLSEQIKEQLDNVAAKIREIDDNWDGLSQDAFVELYEDLQDGLNQAAEAVDGMGDFVVQSAGAFREADEQIASAARNR
ncbi:MAG: WXG100 family type VII secretion target [Oscillibacter sp.]|nr:WXG100 family type VII secretion target [Oscillibacter sp.]